MHRPILAILALASAAMAQPQAPPPPQPPQPSAQAAPPQPPPLVLGRRLDLVRSVGKVSTAVVIVRDNASYIEAISHWTFTNRFPVLIDDGTDSAHENIARFVRAYQPKQVVRWSMPEVPTPPAAGEKILLADLQKAVARAWTIPAEPASQQALFGKWKELQFVPPGIVLMHEGDTAWPAALALAAGHGQPLFEVDSVTGVDGTLTARQADLLEKTAEDAADSTGFSWRTLGDVLESVTLAINCPEKLDTGKPGEFFALSDRIGRISTGVEDGQRWAWCGHIFGNEQESAYRAMCSLFLATHRAWVFDGYPTTEPWNIWDGTKAATLLREVGIKTELDDTPRQGARDWRLRSARAVNANLIFVNTKGNCDFFDLEPGQCKPGDIPILQEPGAVHFVHSWSAQFPASRGTIAGRWLERGIFCYAGSVNEPYLQAFLPQQAAAGRLVSGAPFAAAMRQDTGKLWKIAILGDPLFVVGKDVARYEGIALENTQDVTKDLRALLVAGNYAQALTALTLSGKDTEAAQLATTLLREKPDAVTADVARRAIPAVFRRGDNRGVIHLYQKLGPELSKDPVLRDHLWLAAYPLLESPDDELLRVLHDNVRPEQAGRDATSLGAVWERKYGRPSMDAMLQSVRRTLAPDQQTALDEALKAPFNTWGS